MNTVLRIGEPFINHLKYFYLSSRIYTGSNEREPDSLDFSLQQVILTPEQSSNGSRLVSIPGVLPSSPDGVFSFT